jgi:hypothetical protein
LIKASKQKGEYMKVQMMKGAVGSFVGVIGMAGVAAASNVNVGIDVVTPNVRVSASNLPSPQPVAVVERERVIVHEKEVHHDNGKHKGQHKKSKKHKKHKQQKHHAD